MSRFTDEMFHHAPMSTAGLVTGEPDAPVRHTWTQIHQTAGRMAGGLRRHQVGPGDRVAVLAGQPIDVAPIVQAVWMRGAAVTMLHQPTPRIDVATWASDTAHTLNSLDLTTVVVGAPFDAAADVLDSAGVRVAHADRLADDDPIAPLDCAEDDLALLQLTSGSTGTPKGVAITHRNLFHNRQAMALATELDTSVDVMVNWLPLFHDMGLVGFLVSPMQVGIEAVCVTPADFLTSPLIWPTLITKYRGTMTAAPNFAYSILARRLPYADTGAYDLSSLRFVLNGGEPIDVNTIEAFSTAATRFGLKPTAMVAAYGMAEATLAVSFTRPSDPITSDVVDATSLERHRRATPADFGRRLARLGRPLSGMEVRVVDDDRRPVSVRVVGELEIRGPAVSRSYVGASGIEPAVDARGWLVTGDMGYLTEEDEVVVCGRRKEMIIVAGRNVFPTDVERAAQQVTGVRAGNAAAVRIDSDSPREEFAVAVESNAAADPVGSDRIARQVSKIVFDEIGITPRHIIVLPPGALPKTPSGKLRRTATRELVAARLRGGALDIEREVIAIISAMAPDRAAAVTETASLVDDLAFDSARLLELTTVLEQRFGCCLSDEQRSAAQAVRDIVALVASALDVTVAG